MQFSFVKNDKTTVLDELILLLFICMSIMLGIFCVVVGPSLWIIDSIMFKTVGVILIVTGVMFIPGLIYRLMTNEKKQTKKDLNYQKTGARLPN